MAIMQPQNKPHNGLPGDNAPAGTPMQPGPAPSPHPEIETGGQPIQRKRPGFVPLYQALIIAMIAKVGPEIIEDESMLKLLELKADRLLDRFASF